MNVYPKLNKTKVGYFYTDSETFHKSLEQQFDKINFNEYGCPAVGGLNNRFFKLNALASVSVKFGVKDNEPYYTYEIDTKVHQATELMHNFINDNLNVRLSNTGKCVLQFTTPVVFVTDDKDLEMTLLQPQNNIDINNAVFINGSFYPYGWLRVLNSAYVQIDNTKESSIVFDTSKDMYSLFFNKPIDLKEIEPTEKILNYLKYSDKSINYHKNIKQIFNKIFQKRPKHLL
tara:strand:- start:347 stop:1039 length:693 start_codon:yes stop_codon:yes gene_type:complete